MTDISFEAILPQIQQYPFATYKKTFQKASYFLEKIEKLKTDQKPFQFIISRMTPNGQNLFSTNIKVSLEDYTIEDDSEHGFDIYVTINLKQYKEYATKTIKIKKSTKSSTKKATTSKKRSSNSKSKSKTYKVKKGDCLWSIAKKYYGNGSQYKKIYNANKNKIKNPNLIYPRTSFNYSIGGRTAWII